MKPLNLPVSLLLLLTLAVAIIPINVRADENIAHGIKVLVIDAGHGGRFSGAHYAGVLEKNIALNVALKLGELVRVGMPGVKVVYTRTTDKALSDDLATDLQLRADIANKAGGDLFISIHLNAARSSSARGVETLVMGESSKEQSYNEGALYNNNREDLIDMSDQRTAAIVKAYIQNLQFTYGEYSMAAARCIHNSYNRAGRHIRGIRPQLLRVLYATDMPGILTEIGFMSNAQEMAYMRSEVGQNEIAQSLFRGVKEYSDYVLGTRGLSATPTVEAPIVAVEKPAEKPVVVEKPAVVVEKPVETPVVAEKTVVVDKPVVEVSAEKPETFVIQVIASQKAVALSSDFFKTYKGKVKLYRAEGAFSYKYGVGEYNDRAEAQKALVQVRRVFPQAFVVATRGGKIVK